MTLDAAGLAVPAGGLGLAARVANKSDDVASLMAKNKRAGDLGEIAAEIEKNTQKIPSVSKPGSNRIPDIFSHTSKTIGDVKNTNYQAFTSQLRDIYAHAQKLSYTFQLIVDQRTIVSSTLKQLGDQIEIIRKNLNDITKNN